MTIETLFQRLFAAEGEGAGGAPAAGTSGAAAAGGEAGKPAAAGGAPAGDKGAGDGRPAASGADTAAGSAGDEFVDDLGLDAAADGKPAADSKKPAAAAETGFPEDWKARIVAGLPADLVEKLNKSKRIERASSPADLLRVIAAQDSRLGELSGRIKPLTGKDDDPKDVAAFRKALGIPEAADKYALVGPDGKDMTEADRTVWSEYLPDLHAAGIGQKQLEALVKLDSRRLAQAQKAATDRVTAAAEKAQEDLRVEFGRDYKPNITLANRFLAENMGAFIADGETNPLDKRFADGTALGEHPAFVKWIVSLAKASSDDLPPLTGESREGFDPKARLDEMMKVRITDRARYNTTEFQNELKQVNAAVDRMAARAGSNGRGNGRMSEQGR